MNMGPNRTARVIVILALGAVLLSPAIARAQDEGTWDWPQEILSGDAVITMYQPQLDSWEDNTVESRAAVSVKANADAAPVFGAVWLSARFEVDRDTRMVTFTDIRVPAVKFPESTEEQQAKLAALLEREIPTWDLEISIDQMLPTLDLAEHTENETVGLKHDPPKIIIRHDPAILITIDGQPEYEDIEGTGLQRVVNTPYVIVRDSKDFYLASDTSWYRAGDILGPWSITKNLPSDVQKIDAELEKQRKEMEAETAEETAEEGAEAPTVDSRIPQIVVATEPSELIFIDGPVKMAPLEGNDILFVDNTDSDVIYEVAGQQYYVLLSGRWYRSKDLEEGPWEYVPNDELSDTFAEIPPDSDVGYLRAHVAGTDEAREAVLEQSIPQTAAVNRSDTSFTVEYDGEPKFEAIEDTEMSYAVNTASSVILIGNAYYACDQAVWYLAASPTGPWTVATKIPDEVSEIPPSSPVYNVTHVHIYESTPEVVYVGYTPGYTGSYVSHSCVVYGTGWWYRPWWGHYYYARPATWGFHVRWNPWYGWSFGLSWSNGPFRFTVGFGGWGRYGWGGWWARPDTGRMPAPVSEQATARATGPGTAMGRIVQRTTVARPPATTSTHGPATPIEWLRPATGRTRRPGRRGPPPIAPTTSTPIATAMSIAATTTAAGIGGTRAVGTRPMASRRREIGPGRQPAHSLRHAHRPSHRRDRHQEHSHQLARRHSLRRGPQPAHNHQLARRHSHRRGLQPAHNHQPDHRPGPPGSTAARRPTPAGVP